MYPFKNRGTSVKRRAKQVKNRFQIKGLTSAAYITPQYKTKLIYATDGFRVTPADLRIF